MKKIPFALVLALGLASGSAFADPVANPPVADTSGQITINGKITDSTCYIAVADKDQTVTLSTVAAASLKDSAITAPQRFSINLSGCPAGINVGTKFSSAEGPNSIDVTNGTLKNQLVGTPEAPAATNVTIALLEGGTNNQIEFAKGTFGKSSMVETDTAGTATLDYLAGYYTTDKSSVGAGAVTAKVNFIITYD